MNEHTVIIRWPASPPSTETIHLGRLNDLRARREIVTTERWPNYEQPTRYVAKVTSMKDGPAGVSIVRIRYRECENTGQALENESWGISQITIDTNLKKVNVSWLDDRPHKEFDTIGKATLVIEPERKNRMPVLTPKRARRQEAFRRNLIDLYGRCVLTGEATSEALEAAHIVSVKDEGNDYVGNGLLLRADLHRLFDSKLLKVRSNGTVYFSDTAAVSEEYKKAATKWALAPEVLHRVQRRLGERNDASQETPSK